MSMALWPSVTVPFDHYVRMFCHSSRVEAAFRLQVYSDKCGRWFFWRDMKTIMWAENILSVFRFIRVRVDGTFASITRHYTCSGSNVACRSSTDRSPSIFVSHNKTTEIIPENCIRFPVIVCRFTVSCIGVANCYQDNFSPDSKYFI